MADEKSTQVIGRLAMRVEGEWWKAYYAMPTTMDDAIPLASLHLSLVKQNPELKNQFIALMQAAVATMIEDVSGEVVVEFDTRPAPEHEKAGNA